VSVTLCGSDKKRVYFQRCKLNFLKNFFKKKKGHFFFKKKKEKDLFVKWYKNVALTLCGRDKSRVVFQRCKLDFLKPFF